MCDNIVQGGTKPRHIVNVMIDSMDDVNNALQHFLDQ